MPTVDFRALRTQHTRSSRVVILNNVSNLRLLEIVTVLARLAESQRCAVQLVGPRPVDLPPARLRFPVPPEFPPQPGA
jgi:hypothetical protein